MTNCFCERRSRPLSVEDEQILLNQLLNQRLEKRRYMLSTQLVFFDDIQYRAGGESTLGYVGIVPRYAGAAICDRQYMRYAIRMRYNSSSGVRYPGDV